MLAPVIWFSQRIFLVLHRVLLRKPWRALSCWISVCFAFHLDEMRVLGRDLRTCDFLLTIAYILRNLVVALFTQVFYRSRGHAHAQVVGSYILLGYFHLFRVIGSWHRPIWRVYSKSFLAPKQLVFFSLAFLTHCQGRRLLVLALLLCVVVLLQVDWSLHDPLLMIRLDVWVAHRLFPSLLLAARSSTLHLSHHYLLLSCAHPLHSCALLMLCILVSLVRPCIIHLMLLLLLMQSVQHALVLVVLELSYQILLCLHHFFACLGLRFGLHVDEHLHVLGIHFGRASARRHLICIIHCVIWIYY